MLDGDAGREEEGEADKEDHDVGAGVEYAFGDFVVLVGGALGCGRGKGVSSVCRWGEGRSWDGLVRMSREDLVLR